MPGTPLWKADARAHQHLRIYAADGRKAHEAVFVHVAGNQPDFVHVRGHHDFLAAFAFAGNQVAERIHADFIGQGFDFRANHVTDGGSVAGAARRFR